MVDVTSRARRLIKDARVEFVAEPAGRTRLPAQDA
jgi:hypothetical protein